MDRTGARRRLGAWVVVCAALLAGTGARALSLADLAAGDSLTAGNGVTYQNFQVKIRGGLSKDLSSYQVTVTQDGFALSGGARDERGRGGPMGRIVLRYDVSTDDPQGLLAALLGVDPGDEAALIKARKKLLLGKKKIGKLKAKSGGTLLAEVDLAGLAGLSVKERIKLGGGFAGGSFASGFTAVPEPGTLALTAAGLLALAALGRRARA